MPLTGMLRHGFRQLEITGKPLREVVYSVAACIRVFADDELDLRVNGVDKVVIRPKKAEVKGPFSVRGCVSGLQVGVKLIEYCNEAALRNLLSPPNNSALLLPAFVKLLKRYSMVQFELTLRTAGAEALAEITSSCHRTCLEPPIKVCCANSMPQRATKPVKSCAYEY